MNSTLVRIHHAEYKEDLPFWTAQTQGLDPILEIGCGHGRVTLPLAEAGRIIVGVDRDHEALAYLERVVGKSSRDVQERIRLVNQDIFDYHPDRSFGVVIIPCNTYSTFDAQERSWLIAMARSSLREGGLLLASLPNPAHMEGILAELRVGAGTAEPDLEDIFSHPETGDPVQVSSRLRTSGESLCWDWIYDYLLPDGQVERFVVSVEHFPAPMEIILAELKEGGFHNVRCLGDFSGEPYSRDSDYLILICQK